MLYDTVWQDIGGLASGVVAMAAINDKLFCATNENKLFARNPVRNDIAWQLIGHANNVVAMAAINGKLFCATRDNRLLVRDPVLSDVEWQDIGCAIGVVAMAGEKIVL